MDSALDHHTARALLEWHVELGATEAIGDAPVNRYELPAEAPGARKPAAPQPAPAQPPAIRPAPGPEPAGASAEDAIAAAQAAAEAAQSLEALQAAMAAFEHCALKKGARNLVFSDGDPRAPVMIVGEAPGRDEDIQGKPFVGRAGQLLDKMLAAIDLSRTAENPGKAVYITNVLPWRPPQNRDPRPEEIAMLLPFLRRHVELAGPKLVVVMGNTSCQAALGRRGITRLRGTWVEAYGRPALPMFHPSYLLRSPHAKREAWTDLLALQARLEGEA